MNRVIRDWLVTSCSDFCMVMTQSQYVRSVVMKSLVAALWSQPPDFATIQKYLWRWSMLTLATTLQYEVPYFEIRTKEEALEIVRTFFVSGEKIVVSEDMVIANQRLLEAYLFIGMQEIHVVKLPLDPEDPDMMRNMPGAW